MRFVIVTGMSGAGKSQAVKYLEDMGFFCVDNLPPSLITKFAEICIQPVSKIEKIALVIDIRGGELFKELIPALNDLKQMQIKYEVLFLDASDKVVVKRFKESRRMHPLASEGRLFKGIQEEREILSEIRQRADYIIDTSDITPKQLKKEISNIFANTGTFNGLMINIISFGFKYGIPIECDLVFDVRFIPNPYYIERMRPQTGKDEEVKDYVLNSSETIEFLKKLIDMLEFLLPNYIKEGKTQLVIGIGCTGGRHRSVAIADELGKVLLNYQHRVLTDHRDIEKDGRGGH